MFMAAIFKGATLFFSCFALHLQKYFSHLLYVMKMLALSKSKFRRRMLAGTTGNPIIMGENGMALCNMRGVTIGG